MNSCPIKKKRARLGNGPVKSWPAGYQPSPQCNDKKGSHLLKYSLRSGSFPLKSPAGASLKIGGLGDTIYGEDDDKLNSWGRYYLPKVVSMQVIGVVEGTSYPCEQLVLMTCEDEAVYGFDGEDLHLVASSLKQLMEEGITYPASQKYYRGQAFRDMDDEEWEEMRKRLYQEGLELLKVKKERLLKNLRAVIGAELLNSWGRYYLPKVVSMQVIGVVEGTSYPCEQLVLSR